MNTFYFHRRKNEITTIYFTLRAQASPYDLFQAGGSLAVGDSTISLDGAAFGNTAAQVLNPQADLYSLTLTAAEVNTATTIIKVIDAAGGPNWCEVFIIIETFDQIPNPLHEAALTAAGAELANGDIALGAMSFGEVIQFLRARFLHLNTQTTAAQIQYKADSATALATHAVSYDLVTQTKAAGA